MKKSLENKKIVITGAANGIGRAAAERFYQEGCILCLVDLPREEETELSHQFPERMTYISANVSLPSDIQKIEYWMQENGVDAVINNAGITRDATLLNMTESQWDDVMNVNLKGVFLLAQAAAKKMKEQGFGSIINTASVVAHYGNFGQTNYVASKAGVIGMTKTMAKELGKYNVRVNAVAPGFIGTKMVRAMPEKVVKMMEEKAPLRRLGEPEEIAAAFAFLASDDASFITGTCLNVDGGIILG